ncbi:phage portal protein [Glutamicibacter creatinolyticus]|uniref:phage portal protein n=1 Tax=Glutamicibacter creatinolyticus TaxID=162496 RepID=UPI00321674BF
MPQITTLTMETQNLLIGLESKLANLSSNDVLFDRYYEGTRRLDQIGLAVPPELEFLEVSANWCRVAVDSVADRLKMKGFYLPGETEASAPLRDGWDANNLDSESLLHSQETMIYGRGYVSVSSNEEDPEFPLIQVESPTEISVEVDRRHRRITAAARFYDRADSFGIAQQATLYLPNQTLWLTRLNGGWQVVDRDDHNLGRVPLVLFLNRRRAGKWTGVSEMSDIAQLVDASARALTDLQLAVETHSVPQKWVLGMAKEDFIGKDGKPIPAWEAYFTAIWANRNKDAKVGQFSASDLRNFHDTVKHYGNLAASVTGLPARYFGESTVNPSSFEAIMAEEVRLILNAEKKQTAFGDGWAWVMGLYERFRTGEWINGSRIKAEWFNAATPTLAQSADAATKLYANGQGAISRESVFDALGWSEAEKIRERDRLEREARMEIERLEKYVNEPQVAPVEV